MTRNQKIITEEMYKRFLREPPNRVWEPAAHNPARGRKNLTRAQPASAPKPWQR